MAAAKPSASSSSLVPKKTIQKAVAALLKWKETEPNSQSPKVLEQDEFLYLILTLKKIPPTPGVNPFMIPLPHPLFDPSSSRVCLILDDGPKSKLTKEAAEKRVKQEGLPVSTILKLSKLRADYKSFEAKRDLCDSHDFFLADKWVLPLLPKLLGKQFYKRKKIPIGLDLRLGGWKEQVESVICSGLLFLGRGTCSVVRVARVSMPREEIVENVAAAVVGVVETVPKKWRSVRSLHLKLLESLSLPVYQFRIEGSKGGHETLAQGKKKATKDARQMDIDLDEGDMDDDVDRKEFGDGEDEKADVGNWGEKKRKYRKESGLENGVERKSNTNRDNVDDRVLGQMDGDFAHLKKLNSTLLKQGKPKNAEGGGVATEIVTAVGGKVSEDKKDKRRKTRL